MGKKTPTINFDDDISALFAWMVKYIFNILILNQSFLLRHLLLL